MYQVRDDFISPNLLLIDDYVDNSSVVENIINPIPTLIQTSCMPSEISDEIYGFGSIDISEENNNF